MNLNARYVIWIKTGDREIHFLIIDKNDRWKSRLCIERCYFLAVQSSAIEAERKSKESPGNNLAEMFVVHKIIFNLEQ